MIECDQCKKWVYMDSLNLNEEEKIKLKNTNEEYFCDKCIKTQNCIQIKQKDLCPKK